MSYEIRIAVMRAWLESRSYYKAILAFETIRELETGFRKDGITPKFDHQLSITRLLSTQVDKFLYPEETLIVGLLHDLIEDHETPDGSRDTWIADNFSSRVLKAVRTISKKSPGWIKATDHYYNQIATDPIASLVKTVDRIHNVQTMHGVFSPDKQSQYINEVQTYYFPLIKKARRQFPQQFPVYEAFKIILGIQCELISHTLDDK